MTNSESDHQKNTAYWDEIPGEMGGSSSYLDPFLAWLKRRENLRVVQDWGSLHKAGRLLKTDLFEEAMGQDAFLPDLVDEVGQAIGFDISFELCRRAAMKNADSTLAFLTADVRQLPFRDETFSTITSPSTLDHFPDPTDIHVSLKELYRVLEPGGHLVITIDNRQNMFFPLLRFVHWLGLVPYFLGAGYSEKEFHAELKSAGFEVRESTAILHNPRLVAVAAMKVVRWLRWPWLIRRTQQILLRAQALEHTRWSLFTASFLAALAVRPEAGQRSEFES